MIPRYSDDWIIDALQKKIWASPMRSDITMASMRWHQSKTTPNLERSMWHQTTSRGEKPKAGGPRVQICNPCNPSNPSNETHAHIYLTSPDMKYLTSHWTLPRWIDKSDLQSSTWAELSWCDALMFLIQKVDRPQPWSWRESHLQFSDWNPSSNSWLSEVLNPFRPAFVHAKLHYFTNHILD